MYRSAAFWYLSSRPPKKLKPPPALESVLSAYTITKRQRSCIAIPITTSMNVHRGVAWAVSLFPAVCTMNSVAPRLKENSNINAPFAAEHEGPEPWFRN